MLAVQQEDSSVRDVLGRRNCGFIVLDYTITVGGDQEKMSLTGRTTFQNTRYPTFVGLCSTKQSENCKIRSWIMYDECPALRALEKFSQYFFLELDDRIGFRESAKQSCKLKIIIPKHKAT